MLAEVQGTTNDDYGGVAAVSPTQRAKSRRKISGSNYGPGDGARGHPGDYSPGYEERTPYAVFAGPGAQPHEVYDPSDVPGLRYCHAPGDQESDLLEAAGLGIVAAGAGAAGAAYVINNHQSVHHMLIYQERIPGEASDLYLMAWVIPTYVHHRQANHTLLITNWATIPSVRIHNCNSSQQYTAAVPEVDSPMATTKISTVYQKIPLRLTIRCPHLQHRNVMRNAMPTPMMLWGLALAVTKLVNIS